MERRSEIDIHSIFMSNDNKKIIVCFKNKTIDILNIDTFTSFKKIETIGVTIGNAILTINNKYLVYSDSNNSVYIWDINLNKAPLEIKGSGSKITSLEEILDNNGIIIGSEDKIINITNFTGNSLSKLEGHHAGISRLAVSPDGKYLISGSDDFDLRLWDIKKGKLLKTLDEHDFPIKNIKISPSGNFFVSASKEKIVIWNLKAMKILRKIDQYSQPFKYILFTPDDKYLVGACQNKVICIDLKNYKINAIQKELSKIIFLGISHNGNLLILGTENTIKKYIFTKWIKLFKVDLKETPEHLKIPFRAYKGKERFIFISYAHKDKHLVYPEMLSIHNQNYNIWYDEGIPPTSEWPEEIENAIISCSLFLVFITPNSVESKNVRSEINYALKIDKKLLIVYLEHTELKHGLGLRLNSIQAIIKYELDPENYFKKLLESLSKNLEK